MDSISDYFYHHKSIIIVLVILLIGGIGSAFAMSLEPSEEETLIEEIGKTEEEINVLEETKEEKEYEKNTVNSWRVDVKGAIKNPGVYEVAENTRIYEVIEFAGGLLETATTENINLSKKVTDEMVIYIFSKEEYQKKMSCDIKNDSEGEISKEIGIKESVIDSFHKTEPENQKISLNKATKEELMTLEGIGESKAIQIIEYRTRNHGFQKVEELKEVKGIGEVLYEKIKNYITL